MNCLNRLEIQKCIDNEIEPAFKEEMLGHVKYCQKCSNLYQEAIEEKEMVHTALFELDIFLEETEIQKFNHTHQTPKQNNKKTYFFLKIAGSIILITGLFWIFSKKFKSGYNTFETERAIIEMISDTDPNTQWHNKQMIVIVNDEKGELIHSFLIDNND